jgi:hypothetical protein
MVKVTNGNFQIVLIKKKGNVLFKQPDNTLPRSTRNLINYILG